MALRQGSRNSAPPQVRGAEAAQRHTLAASAVALLFPTCVFSLHTWGTEVPAQSDLEGAAILDNSSLPVAKADEPPAVVGDLHIASEDPHGEAAPTTEHNEETVSDQLGEPPAFDGPLTPREEWLREQNNQLMKKLASMRVSKIDTLQEDEHVRHPGSTQHHTLDHSTPAVSVMLLGAIAFQMALFYLVNWPDDDIQYYAYHVIGRSISIFVSVLTFDAVHDIIESYFQLEDGRGGLAILAAAIQMLVWFVIMQFVTAQVSGAMPWSVEVPEPEEVANEKERAAVEEVWKSRKIGLKCWAGLLTHVTAFAAISTWSRIQQGTFFNQSFWTAILVVPISFMSILALYQGADWVRYFIAMAGDGKISASEELWDEQSEEAENDVMAMALSFTTVQAFQFWFLGTLPDEKGTIQQVLAASHWGRDCVFLAVIAIICSAATFMAFRLASRLCARSKSNENLKARMALILMNYTSICFAWCLFFSIKAFVHWVFPHVHTEALTAKIVIALVVSWVSFVIIFVLDFIADQQTEGSEEQRAFAKIILAKGLLIGFSWEGCFATAFHSISHGFGAWIKIGNLGLSVCLCIVVIPAYRRYILPEMSRRLDVMLSHHKIESIEVS